MGKALSVGDRLVDGFGLVGAEVAYIATDATDPEQQTVPASESWELLGAVADITTTADAGNRTVQLQVVDSEGALFYQTAVNNNVAADATNTIQSFTIGGPSSASGGIVALASGVKVAPGMTVQLVDAAGIAAGDTIELRLLVEKTFIPQ